MNNSKKTICIMLGLWISAFSWNAVAGEYQDYLAAAAAPDVRAKQPGGIRDKLDNMSHEERHEMKIKMKARNELKRREMRERFKQMSPEERKQFKREMLDRMTPEQRERFMARKKKVNQDD